MMPNRSLAVIQQPRQHFEAGGSARGLGGRLCSTFKSTAYRSGTQWANPCVAPDGRHVVAGGADGTVFVWNVRDGGLRR